jgi:hypothetical protein
VSESEVLLLSVLLTIFAVAKLSVVNPRLGRSLWSKLFVAIAEPSASAKLFENVTRSTRMLPRL